MPVLQLTGSDLGGIKLDAALSFPGRIKQALGDWRVGPSITLDDRDVDALARSVEILDQLIERLAGREQ